MVSFFVALIKNYHKLGDSQKKYSVTVWRPEFWNQGVGKTALPLGAAKEDHSWLFQLLVAVGNLQLPWLVATSFQHQPHLHITCSSVSESSLLSQNTLCLSLTRTLLIRFMVHSMMFIQWWNCLTMHFSECIPIIKWCMTINYARNVECFKNRKMSVNVSNAIQY